MVFFFKKPFLKPLLHGNLKFGSQIVVLLAVNKYFHYFWIESMVFSQGSETL